jgi:hypothetical protein
MTPTLLVSTFIVAVLGQAAFVQVLIKFQTFMRSFSFFSRVENVEKGENIFRPCRSNQPPRLLRNDIGADDSLHLFMREARNKNQAKSKDMKNNRTKENR